MHKHTHIYRCSITDLHIHTHSIHTSYYYCIHPTPYILTNVIAGDDVRVTGAYEFLPPYKQLLLRLH